MSLPYYTWKELETKSPVGVFKIEGFTYARMIVEKFEHQEKRQLIYVTSLGMLMKAQKRDFKESHFIFTNEIYNVSFT